MKLFRHLRALLFLAFAFGISTSYLGAQNQYYVAATGGNDSNPGTIGSPWATCNHAIATFTLDAQAGANINFLPSASLHAACGNINRGGNSDAVRLRLVCTAKYTAGTHCKMAGPFIITAANSVDVGAEPQFGFEYTDPNAQVGVDVSWQCGTAATCTYGNGIRTLGNYLHDIGQNATGSALGCPFSGAILAPTGHGHTITGFVARGNLIDHFGLFPGPACNDAHDIYTASANGIIENNILLRAASGAIQVYDQACNTVVSNNVLANSYVGLIFFGANGCTPGLNTVENNVIVNNSTGVTYGGSGNNCSNGPPVRPELFSNNDLFGNGTNFASTQQACETRQNTKSENPTTTFPNYTGTASGDYHLKAGSAMIGGGASSCAAGGQTPCVPSIDFDAVTRPSGGAQDIGAYVFSAAGVPIVSFTPSPLGFSTVAVSSSASLTATLTNNGAANLTFSAATISGTNSGDFSITSTTCVSPLGAGLSCNYVLKFTPSATGARSANLTLNDNASGSPHQLPLTGTGGSVALTLSPTSLDFGVVAPGSSSAAQVTTATNTGSANITIGVESIIGTNAADFPFGGIGTCSNNQTLTPGQSCTVSAKFTPTATGSRTASISVTSNDPTSPDLVTLTGISGAPVVSLSPATFDFGTVQAGTASVAKSFTLTNTGNAPLTFTISTSSGVFAQNNTCTSPLAALASCNISVTFQPSAAGAQSGNLSVTSNAATSPDTAILTGTGTAPSLTLSPASINFVDTLAGSSAPTTDITVSNPGAAAVSVTSVGLIGTNPSEFSTSSCPASIPAGGTCILHVGFNPATSGSKTATLSISDNANGSPHQATLSGLGTIAVMSLPGSAPVFSNQVVGTTSGAQNIAFSNIGNGPMTFTIVLAGTNPGDFVLGTPSCTSPLGAGQNCAVSVQFKPTTTGARSATVQFTDNAAGSPQSKGVSGTGLAAAPAVCPATLNFNFGNQPVSTASGSQPIAVTNCGTANLVISSVTMTGNFTQTNNCGTVIPGAFCTVNASFAPAAAGSLSGSINITSNAATSIDHVTLSGFGTQTGGTLTPSPLAFGSVTVGATSGLTLTFLNTGNTSVTLAAPSVGGTNPGDYTPSSGCTTVAPGANCSIPVAFVPGGAGSRTATLSQIVGSSTINVNLTGTGVATAPAVTLNPTSIDFGNVQTSSPSATSTEQITNSGTAALTISSIAATGANAADYTITSHCPGSLLAGGVCTVDAFCTPSGTGNRVGAITITDSAAGSPHAVTLACNGTSSPAPRVQPSPTSLTFPSTQVFTVSGALVTSITNNGNSNLTFSSVGVGGTNIGDFQLASTCPIGGSGLAPGLNCALTVNFNPQAAGSRSASIVIVDSASDSPQSIPLSGTAFLGVGSLLIPISSIDFGNTTTGTTSAPVVFTVTNTGAATATIAVSVSSEFIESDTCGSSIAAAGFCAVTLKFSPQFVCGQVNTDQTCASNIHLGQFVVTSNTVNSPQTVQLQGTALVQTPPPGPIIVGMGGKVGGGGQLVSGVH